MTDDNAWVFALENRIYTIVKKRCYTTLKAKFPDIEFTQTNRSKQTPHFPTVYIHALPGAEAGQDLSGDGINAVLYTMQIDVTSNTTQNDVNAVVSELVKQFKTLRFSINQFPDISTTTDTFRSVVRVQRLIGADDNFD